ncbi:MAG: hypothetical protein U0939_18890 [Pirellulales bacterium]
MNSPNHTANKPSEPLRTVGRESWALIWQVGLLAIMSIALVVGISILGAEDRDLARRRDNVEHDLDWHRGKVHAREVLAKKQWEELGGPFPPPTQAPSTAELEQLAALVAAAAPSDPAVTGQAAAAVPKDAVKDRSTPPTVDLPSLLKVVKQGNWGGTNAVSDQIKKAGEAVENRTALSNACIEMLNAYRADQRECLVLIELAIAWNHKPLADAITAYLAFAPTRFASPVMFDQAARLASLADREQIVLVLPHLASAKMTRPSGNPLESLTSIPPYAAFAALAPTDSPVFTSLVVSDSPAGDVARGALALRDQWPESMLKEITKVLANPRHPFRNFLLIWLEQSRCPPAFADKLLPFASRMIAPQDAGDIREDLFGVHLIIAATSDKTARQVAASSARLLEKNPETAKQLLLLLLLSYPRHATPVFIQAAEEGKPILPPDLSAACWTAERAIRPPSSELRPPRVMLEQVRDLVDGVVAPELAKSPPSEWTRGLVVFAGDWGGPVTSGVLQNADQGQLERAQLTELVTAAQQKLKSRSRSGSPPPGGER